MHSPSPRSERSTCCSGPGPDFSLFACKHPVTGIAPPDGVRRTPIECAACRAEASEAQAGASPRSARQNRLRVAVIDRDPGSCRYYKPTRRAGLGPPRAVERSDRRSARGDAAERAGRRPGHPRSRELGVSGARVRPAARARRDRLHRPLVGRAAGPRPAARRRRVDDQAVPPRGADLRDRGGGPPSPAQRDAPIEAAASVGEITIRPDLYQAYAGEASLELTAREFEILHLLVAVGPRPAPRGDLRARVGLRDGARRPLGRRVRPQAPPEAARGVSGVELHPHPLRGRLPVRAGARRRATCTRPTSVRTPRCPALDLRGRC